MVDPADAPSLGAAIAQAARDFAERPCLIEANRDRENHRLTYRRFSEQVQPLAAALHAHALQPGERVAIIMTNQSNWLIGAQAVMQCGGTLVPLDYKLSAPEHAALLRHSGARVLLAEYNFFLALQKTDAFAQSAVPCIVTGAPPTAELYGQQRWEACPPPARPLTLVPRTREDVACIVYSSGTGGRPKGCQLTHGCYLNQAAALLGLFRFDPGDRYLSILPTNHAIDFMVGFIGPFLCGATVVHLRTLRPEFIRDAFTRYHINYMAVVPMILKNLEVGLRERFAALPWVQRRWLGAMIALNRLLTRRRPNLALSRRLLAPIHQRFGGRLKAFFVGGAFTEPATLHFFHDLGIPVANGYGLTEAGTAVTLSDLNTFRADTVGRPLPGVELKVVDPDAAGIGEVAVRSPTLMSGYLDDPELTAQTLVGGWLMTGDLGRLEADGQLKLVGRRRNMIVTPGGKNIYPEDIENGLEGLAVKEFCVFAADFIWPRRDLVGEKLVAVVHPLPPARDLTATVRDDLVRRNRQLLDYQRVSGVVVWNQDFPRTASLKVKRDQLAEAIAASCSRDTAVQVL